LLGDAAINIGGMQVSRDDSGNALIVLTVDSAVSADQVSSIAAQIGASAGRAIDLEE